MRGGGFSIEVKFYKGLNFAVIIEDTDNQGISVTNSIEDILRNFLLRESFTIDGCVYKDSTGTWDGFNYQKKDFVLLGLDSDTDLDRIIATYILKDRIFRT